MNYIRLFFLLIAFVNLHAQFNEYDADYDWYTIKGKHVYVHFHPEAERTARVVLKIAEEVWEPITSLYKYEPETVHFVIKDIDDYSNGATYFFDNKIEIWASALDFDLRGTHNWLRNVISHEFTHMVQIQSSMKIGRSIPAVYLQFLNYEDKRRQDILYGFPNVIVSYPLATLNMPAWFAEGTAQYMRKEFNYDNWDTHRDMILRSYALDNNFLTWNQMGVFGKTSLGNESVYNMGFALTRYIAQRYGEDKLREITYKLGDLFNFTIDAAFKDVLGKDGQEIYDEWTSLLKKTYAERSAAVKNNLVAGKIIAEKGFGNFYPLISGDGNKVYYVSNKDADYFSQSSLFEYDLKSGKEKLIKEGIRSSLGLSGDGKFLIYAKLSDDNPKWRKIHDVYLYDLQTEEEKRLTYGLRANNPSLSHDGKQIVFVFQKDGTSNIGTVDINGKNFRRLTFFDHGEQVFNPKFSPDDSFIIFGYAIHHGRDIARVNTDGSDFGFIINDKNLDERNAVFAGNGKLIYSKDENGIFNLYEFDLNSKKEKQITNVLGGAFMPAVNGNGNIAYAGYTSKGYKIFYLPKKSRKEIPAEAKYKRFVNYPVKQAPSLNDFPEEYFKRLRNFDDTKVPEVKKEPYKGFFTSLTVLPFIRYDNYNTSNSGIDKIKPGVYLGSTDMLNRYSLFAGGSINKRFERDLFLLVEYRNKLPLLYDLGLKPELSLELYSISRKTDVDIFFGVDKTFDPPKYEDSVKTGVTYNLLEFDLSAKHKIFNKKNELEFRFTFSKYSAALGSFILPNSNTLYPATSDNYFIGRSLMLKYTYQKFVPYVDSDINPVGRKVELKYNYDFDKYNPDSEYEVENGILVPVFKKFNFHRVELNWEEHLSLFDNHTLSLRLRGGSILGPTVPDFFDFYLGGLVGMKSYPFYSVSGNEIAWLNLTYRFPLFRNIDTRIGHIYIDKIYFSVYGDLGNAWNGEIPEFNSFKKGAGAELRIKMNSFYLFPTSLFFSAAYSFDTYTRKVFNETVTYGKEWQLYGGILFDFNF